MTTTIPDRAADELLKGQRVALVGKLAGMSKREAQQLVRRHGGTVIERPDASATLVVVGEHELPLSDGPLEDAFEPAVCEAVDRGTLEDHPRSAALATPGHGRPRAAHPQLVYAGHVGQVAGGIRLGDSPLAAPRLDRASPRGTPAVVFRFSRGRYRAATDRAVGRRHVGHDAGKEAGRAGPILARHQATAGAIVDYCRRQAPVGAARRWAVRGRRAVAVRFWRHGRR